MPGCKLAMPLSGGASECSPRGRWSRPRSPPWLCTARRSQPVLAGLELMLKTAGDDAPPFMLDFLSHGHKAGSQVVLGFVARLDSKAIKALADGLSKLPADGPGGSAPGARCPPRSRCVAGGRCGCRQRQPCREGRRAGGPGRRWRLLDRSLAGAGHREGRRRGQHCPAQPGDRLRRRSGPGAR